ncbi:hypothetical protein Pmani_006333 [Petrolisthes manimaculis]|uniref:Uncharacterized protein n=1 Tax=Petrolisthes manimaculis TaxID=1843537 RepID=A0AAE1QA11_9EUCA|nr:hypothetical protein Pmani_006333 [Petrolisthes manimaculis]
MLLIRVNRLASALIAQDCRWRTLGLLHKTGVGRRLLLRPGFEVIGGKKMTGKGNEPQVGCGCGRGGNLEVSDRRDVQCVWRRGEHKEKRPTPPPASQPLRLHSLHNRQQVSRFMTAHITQQLTTKQTIRAG